MKGRFYKMTNKHYYAGHSYMGIKYTYDSPCWTAYTFDSKKERDQFVENGEYNDQGNRVAEVIDRKTAYKIAGIGKYFRANIRRDDNRLEAIPE